MTKHVTPAIEEKITFTCDRCGKEIMRVLFACTIEVWDRDYGGGVVYSHELHLCQPCGVLFEEWRKTSIEP